MKNIPLSKAFQRLMWQEMSRDPDWSELMDTLVSRLPKGDPWPREI